MSEEPTCWEIYEKGRRIMLVYTASEMEAVTKNNAKREAVPLYRHAPKRWHPWETSFFAYVTGFFDMLDARSRGDEELEDDICGDLDDRWKEMAEPEADLVRRLSKLINERKAPAHREIAKQSKVERVRKTMARAAQLEKDLGLPQTIDSVQVTQHQGTTSYLAEDDDDRVEVTFRGVDGLLTVYDSDRATTAEVLVEPVIDVLVNAGLVRLAHDEENT